MKHLNPTTKRAQGFIASYKRAKVDSLNYAYKKASEITQLSIDCRRCDCLNNPFYISDSLRLTGVNGLFFSVGFLTKENGRLFLHYITYANEYVIEYD